MTPQALKYVVAVAEENLFGRASSATPAVSSPRFFSFGVRPVAGRSSRSNTPSLTMGRSRSGCADGAPGREAGGAGAHDHDIGFDGS